MKLTEAEWQIMNALWLTVLVKLMVSPGVHLDTGLVTHIKFWPETTAIHAQELVSAETPVSFTIADDLVGHQNQTAETGNVPGVRKAAQPAQA